MADLTIHKIQELALDQLRQWEAYAKRWNMRLEMRQWNHRDQWHFVCAGYAHSEADDMPWGGCQTSIVTVHDGANGYLLSTESILARVVAHLRNVHREIESTVYGEGNGRENTDLAGNSHNLVGSVGNRRNADRRQDQKRHPENSAKSRRGPTAY